MDLELDLDLDSDLSTRQAMKLELESRTTDTDNNSINNINDNDYSLVNNNEEPTPGDSNSSSSSSRQVVVEGNPSLLLDDNNVNDDQGQGQPFLVSSPALETHWIKTDDIIVQDEGLALTTGTATTTTGTCFVRIEKVQEVDEDRPTNSDVIKDHKQDLSSMSMQMMFSEDIVPHQDDGEVDKASSPLCHSMCAEEKMQHCSMPAGPGDPDLTLESKEVTLEELKRGTVREADLKGLSKEELVLLLLQAVEELRSLSDTPAQREQKAVIVNLHAEQEEIPASTRGVNEGAEDDDVIEIVGQPPPVTTTKLDRSCRRTLRSKSSTSRSKLTTPHKRTSKEEKRNARKKDGKRNDKHDTSSKTLPKKASGSQQNTTVKPVSKKSQHRSAEKSSLSKSSAEKLRREKKSGRPIRGDVSLEEKWMSVLQSLRAKLSSSGTARSSSSTLLAKRRSSSTTASQGKGKVGTAPQVSGYPCQICGKVLKNKESFYHHYRGLHMKNKPYACKLCPESFNFHHSYKLHMQKHRGERPHKCHMCSKSYLTSNHLQVHFNAVHKQNATKCDKCGKQFLYKSSLRLHMQTHSEFPFGCKQCHKRFSTEQELMDHDKGHKCTRNVSCEKCGKTFKNIYTKRSHMVVHDENRAVVMCDICGKTYLCKKTLMEHKVTHTSETPFSCSICDKKFKHRTSLYHHKRMHQEPQTFLCNVCGKSFGRKHLVMAHTKRQHGESQRFPCPTCGAVFPTKHGLSKHTHTIHMPKKYFCCTLCGKRGTRSDNMRTHLKSHHDSSEPLDPAIHIIEETPSLGSYPETTIRRRMRNPKRKNLPENFAPVCSPGGSGSLLKQDSLLPGVAETGERGQGVSPLGVSGMVTEVLPPQYSVSPQVSQVASLTGQDRSAQMIASTSSFHQGGDFEPPLLPYPVHINQSVIYFSKEF